MRVKGSMGHTSVSLVVGCLAAFLAGCDSTIHKQANIAGVETLSIDAKQRLMLVGHRHGDLNKPVTCTEPSPDALVARAAALSGSANFQQPGTPATGDETRAAGSFSLATSETAASIGFRDHTVQMLRDGYFRLCEAYLNGALSKEQYEHMITNADTFMVVVSALQVLGSNPVAPAVVVPAGTVTAATTAPGAEQPSTTVTITPPASSVTAVTATATPNAQNAKMAAQIVEAYLNHRARLTKYMGEQKMRQVRAQMRQHPKHPEK